MTVKVKPQTILDCEVILSEALGDAKQVERYLEIYKEKGRPTAIIKPKLRYTPNTIWKLIHKKVREMDGHWRRVEGIWTVPLVEKPVK